MNPCLVAKLRPTTPWRIAPDSGARDQTGVLFHSDSLYSAVTLAMGSLGWMEDWLTATANRSDPAVRFSSCFPFLDEEMLVAPPRHLWPPPPSARVRWKASRFVPIEVVRMLVEQAGARLREDDGWAVDALSGCLLRSGKDGRPRVPFRAGLRRNAAVDRLTGLASEPQLTACLEFGEGAGVWFLSVFHDAEAALNWGERLRAALRLLADSGFGGQRSRGWGRAETPEFVDAQFPDFLIADSGNGKMAAPAGEGEPEETPPAPPESVETGYWLLSLFSPSAEDRVDWSRGAYQTIDRQGRVESHGDPKLVLRMVSEGSVVLSPSMPTGRTANVAPADFPHPVYRAGYALAIPIAWRVPV